MPDSQPPVAPGKTLSGALGAILLMVPMAVAWAEPATVDVFANTRYSDNINKNQQNPQTEYEHRVGIGINKTAVGGPCEGDASGEVAFIHYQEETNDDEVTGLLDLNGQCQPNPWFRWNARNTLRDVRSDAAAPDSPANRERRNVFATGPTFIWPITPRDELSLDLEYQMTRFQESTVDDTDRYTATSRWTRLFTRQLQGGLFASYSDIDIRRTNEELTQEEVGAFFQYERGQGLWSGEIGNTWLTSEQGPFEQRTSALTGNLRYAHQWTPDTGGFIGVRRQLTDASTDLDLEIPGLDFNLRETTAVEVTAVNAGLQQAWTQRTDSSLEVAWTESQYQRSGVREERYTANADTNHRFTEQVTGNWRLGYDREDFDIGEVLFHTYRTSIGLDYQRTRALSFDAAAGYEKRDIEGGGGNRYDEAWVLLGVRYNLR